MYFSCRQWVYVMHFDFVLIAIHIQILRYQLHSCADHFQHEWCHIVKLKVEVDCCTLCSPSQQFRNTNTRNRILYKDRQWKIITWDLHRIGCSTTPSTTYVSSNSILNEFKSHFSVIFFFLLYYTPIGADCIISVCDMFGGIFTSIRI